MILVPWYPGKGRTFVLGVRVVCICIIDAYVLTRRPILSIGPIEGVAYNNAKFTTKRTNCTIRFTQLYYVHGHWLCTNRRRWSISQYWTANHRSSLRFRAPAVVPQTPAKSSWRAVAAQALLTFLSCFLGAKSSGIIS